MNPRCLIIGGRGFIGTHLVNKLLKEKYIVRVFDMLDSSPSNNLFANEKVEYIYGDFREYQVILNAMDKCDYCFHFASMTNPKSSNIDIKFDINSNLIGSLNILEAAVKHKIKKFIFMSSGGTVYGRSDGKIITENNHTDPICSYGITKLAIEKYLQLYKILFGLDSISLRLSNPYGEGQNPKSEQGAIAVFLGKCINNEQIEIWGDGSVIRDYIYISDVIDACILCITKTYSVDFLNISSGNPMSLLHVLDCMELVTGKKIKRIFKDGRPFDVSFNVLSPALANQILGWSPRVSFLDGLTKTVDWQINTYSNFQNNL